jgi:hypothetical protein
MTVLFPEAPGAFSQRRDKSAFVSSTGGMVAAITTYSLKGPTKPVLLTSIAQLDAMYGRPDPKVSYAHYGARTILKAGFPVYMNRVTNNAKYGGAAVLSNAASNTVSVDKYPTGGSAFPAESDPSTGITPTGPSYIALTFDGPLVTSNVVNLNIVADSQVVAVGPVTYSTSSDATMVALAAAIEAGLATLGSDGKATVMDTDATNSTNARTIGIYAPSGQQIAITNVAVTAGATQAVATQQTPLFYVQAENPGEHSQGIGYKLTNADVGTKEVVRLTLSAAIGSVASITATVNGVACTAVSNVIPSDAAVAALAAALTAHADIEKAEVIKKPLGESNDREIIVTMLRGSSTAATFSFATTGSAPTIAVTQQVRGVSPTGAFDLEVYTTENPTVAAERHRVNLAQVADAFGVQQKIDYVVNKSGTKSDFIRVIPNAPDDGSVVIPFDPATGNISTGITWLSAGSNGSLPSSAQIAEAWKVFEDTQVYSCNVLVNTGYTAVSIQQAMAEVAAKRYDGTEAILDVPPEHQKYAALVNYRLQQMAIDSEFAAIYYPDVQQQDPYTGMQLWVPPSAHVAVVYGRSDQARGIGKAPAGLSRGQVDTTDVRHRYNETEEGHLFNRLKMNIIKREGTSFVVWGDTTAQFIDSGFSFISITRLVGFLEGRIRQLSKAKVFEGNTDVEIFSLTQAIDKFLQPYKPSDLAEYLIVSNGDNNSNGIIEQGNRIVDVILDPVRTMRRILVRTTVTSTGGIASIEVREID